MGYRVNKRSIKMEVGERERESDWQSETNIFNPKWTIHLTSKVKLSCSVKLQIHFTDLFQIVFWALANWHKTLAKTFAGKLTRWRNDRLPRHPSALLVLRHNQEVFKFLLIFFFFFTLSLLLVWPTYPSQIRDGMVLWRWMLSDVLEESLQAFSLLKFSARSLNVIVCISSRPVEFTEQVTNS